jgi:hypothetical protein
MSPMPFEDLEKVYECLAEAIDRAGPDSEALFLTKLALTLGHKLGDAAAFQDAVVMALQDLPPNSDKSSAAGATFRAVFRRCERGGAAMECRHWWVFGGIRSRYSALRTECSDHSVNTSDTAPAASGSAAPRPARTR